jgi:hypothetical protein
MTLQRKKLKRISSEQVQKSQHIIFSKEDLNDHKFLIRNYRDKSTGEKLFKLLKTRTTNTDFTI